MQCYLSDTYNIPLQPKTVPRRNTIIEQAFNHLQHNGQGKVTVAIIEKTYNTADDPQLGTLEWKGSQGLESITKAFKGPKGKDTVRLLRNCGTVIDFTKGKLFILIFCLKKVKVSSYIAQYPVI